MIHIEVITHNGKIAKLHAAGHAESAPEGHDLVCAAVSAILQGGFNALEGSDYDFEVKKGLGSVTCLKEPNQHDQTVLETIVTQLESVAFAYPKNVALERK